jgi:hypothetical protein
MNALLQLTYAYIIKRSNFYAKILLSEINFIKCHKNLFIILNYNFINRINLFNPILLKIIYHTIYFWIVSI